MTVPRDFIHSLVCTSICWYNLDFGNKTLVIFIVIVIVFVIVIGFTDIGLNDLGSNVIGSNNTGSKKRDLAAALGPEIFIT